MIDWQRIWREEDALRRFSPFGAMLWTFSVFYRMAVSARNRLYDRGLFKSVWLPRPVISVGNLTVGGTGKTPFVIWLARMLKRRGFRPAVLSRGYGGQSGAPVNVVSDGQTILLSARTAGDEPLLIARSLQDIPVLTGPYRDWTGKAAIDRFSADVLICDDAFQHRRLHRDCDILLLVARRRFGNGHCLPRGELREPPRGLQRASLLILTRADQMHPSSEGVRRIAAQYGIPVFSSAHRLCDLVSPATGDRSPIQVLHQKRICAFCGIARPDSFQSLLEEAGASIVSFNPFPDHYVFRPADLDALRREFIRLNADFLVTTEKDAARLTDDPDFYRLISVARMDIVIDQVQRCEDFIVSRMGA